jgi:hypothetical protein
VDHIIPFEEDIPFSLIRLIEPDVFVKGGDYTLELLPEAPLVEELGGQVHILPYIENHSTSGIIERIREAFARELSNSEQVLEPVTALPSSLPALVLPASSPDRTLLASDTKEPAIKSATSKQPITKRAAGKKLEAKGRGRKEIADQAVGPNGAAKQPVKRRPAPKKP